MDIRKILGKDEIVKSIDADLYRQCKRKWDGIAKPLDGMGVFEELISRINAIHGKTACSFEKTAILVFCADNGIVEEGVSQSDQSVTATCAERIAAGQSAVGQMAAAIGVLIEAVDVGMNTKKDIHGVRKCKIRSGSRNFHKEPAMTDEEMYKAMEVGFALVERYKNEGYELLGMGEMGIGNTTTCAAVCASLLGCDAGLVTGAGAGADKAQMVRKINVISQAIEDYDLYQKTPLEVLKTVGGYDIAALVGMCIGGAYYHMPIVLDGLISMTAALVAVRMIPAVKEYLIPSHAGKEPAIEKVCKELELSPVIAANMALGEGTGAVLMISLLKSANAVYFNNVTFESYGIDQYERYE